MFKINFEQFKNDPVKAILYLSLGVIAYLYIENRAVQNKQIEFLISENNKKELKINQLQNDIKHLTIKISEIND